MLNKEITDKHALIKCIKHICIHCCCWILHNSWQSCA